MSASGRGDRCGGRGGRGAPRRWREARREEELGALRRRGGPAGHNGVVVHRRHADRGVGLRRCRTFVRDDDGLELRGGGRALLAPPAQQPPPLAARPAPEQGLVQELRALGGRLAGDDRGDDDPGARAGEASGAVLGAPCDPARPERVSEQDDHGRGAERPGADARRAHPPGVRLLHVFGQEGAAAEDALGGVPPQGLAPGGGRGGR
mmetsp:Transcript_116913/g.327132  ORF Transcript_116913/g.327132 Transcript_116913/m.327132 type:complete len:207 (+) Transcript_116913:166-786(+)